MREIMHMCAVRLYYVTIDTLGRYFGLTNQLYMSSSSTCNDTAKVYNQDEGCDTDYPPSPKSDNDSAPLFELDYSYDASDFDEPNIHEEAVGENIAQKGINWNTVLDVVARSLSLGHKKDLLPKEPTLNCGLSVTSYEQATDVVTKGLCCNFSNNFLRLHNTSSYKTFLTCVLNS